jgi:hypothetical protein
MAATPHSIVSVHLLDAAGRLLRVLFIDREGRISAQPYYLPREVPLILAANQQGCSGLWPGCRCSEPTTPQGIDPSVLSGCRVAVTTQAPHHPRDPWVAAGDRPPSWGSSNVSVPPVHTGTSWPVSVSMRSRGQPSASKIRRKRRLLGSPMPGQREGAPGRFVLPLGCVLGVPAQPATGQPHGGARAVAAAHWDVERGATSAYGDRA